jgi:hypothetical protein
MGDTAFAVDSPSKTNAQVFGILHYDLLHSKNVKGASVHFTSLPSLLLGMKLPNPKNAVHSK